jgi:isopentenyl phosphate kinase
MWKYFYHVAVMVSQFLEAHADSASLTWHVLRLFLVTGAGSYGHFQASKAGVNKGDLKNPLVKAGFVATRISVSL